jgi:anti-sigma B factor antagonist
MPSDDVADRGVTPPRFRDPADEPQLPLGYSLRPPGPVQLRIAHHPRGDATVVTVAGELDILTAARFSAFVGELVRRQVGDLLIDLRQARFVDSAGLQILLSAQRRVSRQARWLGVICPPSPVRRVIELARLTEPLGVVSSFEEYERRRRDPGAAA